MITREWLISLMTEAFRNRTDVYALWLEGSDGLGRADDYSDLDFWLDVEDGREEAVLDECETLLRSQGKLDFCQRVNHPHPKIFQRNMHIVGTSPYLLLDICVQSHSRGAEGCTFVEGDGAEYPRILFDKAEVIHIVPPPPPDIETLRAELEQQRELFVQRSRVVKYLERGLFLEAHAYYEKYVCAPVLVLARMLYTPRHVEYGLVHASSHLPCEAVDRLEKLYSAASLEDIRERLPLADTLFSQWEGAVRQQYGI